MISWYIASRSFMGASSQSSSGSPGEVTLGELETFHEGVDLLRRRVEVRRRAHAGLHAEPQVGRLGAVVPGPHGDALAVEQLRHVVGVDALELEAHRSPAQLGLLGADHADAGDGRQPL